MMDSQTYAIVDIETTGHSSQNGDRIIQIAIVLMKDWEVQSTYTTFIHPGKKIPRFIQDLTNITDFDVKDAKPFEAHAEEIYNILQDCVFVAHNTDFDLPFLQAELKRAGLPKWFGKQMDTVELSKILFPTAFSYKLQDIAMELNISLKHAHRADDDANATALLLKRGWKELLTLPLSTIEQLHQRSFRLKSDLSQLFFDAIQLKRAASKQSDSHFYYKNLALRGVVIETPAEVKLTYPQADAEKELLFSRAFKDFEVRSDQFKMMDQVWQALKTKQEVLTEASTGIGKTLAYLIPAIIYVKQTNGKVAISSYTSHLLDQLLAEELPKAEAILQTTVNVAILKGMEHYIDVDRFVELFVVDDVSYDEAFTMMQLLVWLANTTTGDLNEITLSGGGQLLVDKIRRSSTTAVSRGKNYFDFYEYAIKKSKAADLIITNHAMLLSDLTRIEPVLASVNGWILDEAHQFIQAATLRDEKVLSYTQWKYIFGQLGTVDEHQLIHDYFKLMTDSEKIPIRQLSKLETKYCEMVQIFDAAIHQIINQLNIQKSGSRHNKRTFPLNSLTTQQPLYEKVSHVIGEWVQFAKELSDTFLQYPDDLSPWQQTILSDWHYWLRELTIKVAEWDAIFLTFDKDCSAWIELDLRSIPGSLHVYKRPIRVEQSVTAVLDRFRTQAGIIWASGTLTVPNNQRFIADQLGLQSSVPLFQFQAPHSYYDGASLYIVEDMPEIQQVSQTEYVEAVADAIIQTVLVTEGRCFVLFTSQDMLRKTVELIQETEALSDYMLFAQGMSSGSRMRLLKLFQKFNHSVLFGTNSFWEGVDVPGDALSAVIVVRLPFSAPEEPIFRARAEVLTEQGLNSFYKLALPEAILRFKQGFGRLIRSSQDKGVFIVLDRRIETKSYGKEFIHSLPAIPVKKVSLQHMVLELEHWYNNKVWG
ncbi:ATP-dependent DNA helicase DinG [Viridibacillus sp. YIM B01967]|uniref:3'-5' exonuclease DinG n=1 Tax=Viridibacillus soli TaxID=2798301 RepID=A0ABS1HBB8_9BACL|nr:ATP-dependent DNA helicase DinG [Viridibacillus soli]MBK3496749.1 ATP-dependent DNA helicase DinG [Viridibacillus soli]